MPKSSFKGTNTYSDTDKLINAYQSDIEWSDEHLDLLIDEILDLDKKLTISELELQNLKQKLKDLSHD